MQRQCCELQNRALGSPLLILYRSYHHSYDQYLPIYRILKVRIPHQEMQKMLWFHFLASIQLTFEKDKAGV